MLMAVSIEFTQYVKMLYGVLVVRVTVSETLEDQIPSTQASWLSLTTHVTPSASFRLRRASLVYQGSMHWI